MKYYTYKGTKIRLEKQEYRSNGTLAVAMYSQNGELYDVITVNLQDRMQSDTMVYLDVKNHPGIGRWLQRRGLALPMYYTHRSGFVEYPLYTIMF